VRGLPARSPLTPPLFPFVEEFLQGRGGAQDDLRLVLLARQLLYVNQASWSDVVKAQQKKHVATASGWADSLLRDRASRALPGLGG